MPNSPRYLPRKGTETTRKQPAVVDVYILYSPRYLPRKGTETYGLLVMSKKYTPCRKFATIFTPQGDGNAIASVLQAEGYEVIRHDIYPARGRKQRSRKKAKVESKKNDSSPYQHKLTNQNPS